MSSASVCSESELRKLIKAPPSTVMAKILSGPLKSSPSEFVAAARLGVMTVVGASAARSIFAIGGAPGFVQFDAANGDLIIPVPEAFDRDVSFGGLLLMVSGVRHTFRVNGSVRHDGASLLLTPNESYPHCAKALIRSKLWSNEVAPTALKQGAASTGELEVVGDAVISTDADLLASAAVDGNQPKLGIIVTVQSAMLSHSPAIVESGAWDNATHTDEADLPTIGALVADPGQTASLAKRALTGITDRAVNSDYKRNLY